MDVNKMRNEAYEMLQKQKGMMKIAEGESRNLTATEQSEFDTLNEKRTSLLDSADRMEMLEQEEARAAKASGKVISVGGAGAENRAKNPFRKKAYRTGRLKCFRGDNAEEKAFRFFHFFRANLCGNKRSQEICQSEGIEYRAGQVGDVDDKGGFTVPDEFAQFIIDNREMYGAFRRSIVVTPMASDVLHISKRASGLAPATFWVANQGDVLQETTKTWARVTLTAQKMGTIVPYSTELDEDASISTGDDLANEIAWSFALEEDRVCFLGTGIAGDGNITGIQTAIHAVASNAGVVTATGETSYGALTLGTFEAMMGVLPEYAAVRSPRWYISRPAFYASMSKLMTESGGNTIGDIAAGSPMQFLGVPVTIVQVMDKNLSAQVGQPAGVLLGDLGSACTFGERRAITIQTDQSVFFVTDEIAIKGTERIDMQAHSPGTSSEAGPVVGLEFG